MEKGDVIRFSAFGDDDPARSICATIDDPTATFASAAATAQRELGLSGACEWIDPDSGTMIQGEDLTFADLPRSESGEKQAQALTMWTSAATVN